MYADTVTAVDAGRARGNDAAPAQLQEAYNKEHGITPASIVKAIDDVSLSIYNLDYRHPPGHGGS